jgi:hypothetical protein
MVEPKYNKDKKFVIQAHNPPPNNIKGVNHRVLCPGSYEFVQGYKPADGLIG